MNKHFTLKAVKNIIHLDSYFFLSRKREWLYLVSFCCFLCFWDILDLDWEGGSEIYGSTAESTVSPKWKWICIWENKKGILTCSALWFKKEEEEKSIIIEGFTGDIFPLWSTQTVHIERRKVSTIPKNTWGMTLQSCYSW